MGYHLKEIPKGIFGDSSKIYEEVLELIDSEEQKSKIMALNELSDLIGAIKGYLDKNFKDISLDDLIIMSKITEKVFKDGTRK